jgi:two-component system, chemotaxis family, chemotaxis protein CheY
MRSLTILYVEDHVLLLRLMRELLEVQGWLVETCRDGWAALEKIEGESDYGVVVVDDSLPDLGGLEIVRRARRLAHRRRTPIILLARARRCWPALTSVWGKLWTQTSSLKPSGG